VIEIFFAALFAVLGGLIYRSRLKGYSRAGRGYRIAFLVADGAIILTLLILSEYHFTHQGIPSGCIELAMAAILTTIGVLIYRERVL
jgi:hypothetical protein